MDLLLTGGSVFRNHGFEPADVAIRNGRIVSVSASLPRDGFSVIECRDRLIVPGFVDVHVHLREPGFSYKETIASGTAAAAAGGYTAVCAMPNLNPVPDSPAHLEPERRAIEQDACVHVYPYGAITVEQKGAALADLRGLAPYVCAFSDDGHGVQDAALMQQAMEQVKALGLRIVAHCEVNDLLTPGGCIHAGRWAQAHGLPGISSESEWKMIERDLALVRKTGCPYHVCHISAKESVDLIRRAKAEGLPVSCETGPHYLVLCEDDLQDAGRFNMNPPLRSRADQEALLEGLLDGTIDCIATDHAPHSAEEKAKGLQGSAFGIVGLETAFPVLYTRLVEPGIVPLELLLDRLCLRPRSLFRLPGGAVEPGAPADLAVLDLHAPHTVRPERFFSMGQATPFAGWSLSAAVCATLCRGIPVYIREGGIH